MSTTLSFRHISFQVNGHEFTAWADEDPPVDFDKVDLLEITRGRDGTLYTSDKGVRGGNVTVKLLPTSPSAIRCLQWLNESLQDEDLDFEAIYADSRLGIALTLQGGKLMGCDPTIVDGKTFECTWVFEEFVPDVDGATLAPGPAVTQ